MQYTAQYMTLAVPTLLQNVAARLRELRGAHEWSQQTLAERAGISRRMLAAVESGQSNVSIATLDRLAFALAVSISDLIRESPAKSVPIPPVLVWQGAHPDSQVNLLHSVVAKKLVELWSWSLAPSERYDAEPDRPGMQELIYVVEGTLTLEIGGDQQRVEQGKSVAFPSDRQYSYVNQENTMLRFINNSVE